MKRVKLFFQTDEYDVGLVFVWDKGEKAWICKMENSFMQELGHLPCEKETG